MHGRDQRNSRTVQSPESCLRFFRSQSGSGVHEESSLLGRCSSGGSAVLGDVSGLCAEYAKLVVPAALVFLRREMSSGVELAC